MRTADIKVGETYRLRDRGKATVLKTGIPQSVYSDRKDGTRVEFRGGPMGVRMERVVATRDILRPWTSEDDTRVELERQRASAEVQLNTELGDLGFTRAHATVKMRPEAPGVHEVALSFKGADAERILALLRLNGVRP
jgi:hypothetical protein